MKITHLVSACIACVFLVVRAGAATDIAVEWTTELGLAQQAYNQNDGGRARADGIVQTILDTVRNGMPVQGSSGRSFEQAPVGANLDAAAAQGTYSALAILYPGRLSALDATLAESLASIADIPAAISAGREWGRHVAEIVLEEHSEALSLNNRERIRAAQSAGNPTTTLSSEAETIVGPGRYQFGVLAGVLGAKGYVDGSGTAARFDYPSGIAVDGRGNVYVSEGVLNVIRKITPDGTVTTLAGVAGQKGSQDGGRGEARFNAPGGMATDSRGNIYVADTQNHTIRKIDPAGSVTTIAGKAGQSGSADGSNEDARFSYPGNLAFDAAGNLFVTEGNYASYHDPMLPGHPIRRIAPDGTVSHLIVGTPTAKDPYYNTPRQICADPTGVLYVVDTNDWDYSSVVRLTPSDGEHYQASRLLPPEGLTYLAATGLGIDARGRLVVRFAGSPPCIYTPGSGWQTANVTGNWDDFSWGEMCAVDGSGNYYLVGNEAWGEPDQSWAVVVGTYDPNGTGPVILVQPKAQTPWRGESARFEVTAAGTSTLSYQWYRNSKPIAGENDRVLEIKNVQREILGNYTVVVTDGVGSVTSRKVGLGMYSSDSNSTGSSSTGSSGTSSGSDDSHSSGGGSFEGGMSLALLALLAAAAVCRARRPAVCRLRRPSSRRSRRRGISRPGAFQDNPTTEK